MAKCPYCKKKVDLNSIKQEKKGVGIFKQEVMYSCPHCESVLGISRGKYMS